MILTILQIIGYPIMLYMGYKLGKGNRNEFNRRNN